MHLSHRVARPEELATHFQTLGEAFVYPPSVRDRVPGLWARWMRDGAFTAQVIERHEAGRVTVEAFGAMLFVRKEALEDCRARPYVRAELIRRALAGEPVALTLEEMREANRGEGLSLLILADPRGRRGLEEEHYRFIDTKWSEALYEFSGCNLRAIWHEVYGERVMRHVAGCGLHLYEDWARHWETHPPRPPDDVCPYLLGVTRPEVAPGTHAAFLFSHVRPQFEFTARQQELLQQALAGSTDDELAAQMSVSASAVKKRWISVYERVSGAMPGWLESATGSGEVRGSEKRRHLLNYLRQHPEELHPACASRD